VTNDVGTFVNEYRHEVGHYMTSRDGVTHCVLLCEYHLSDQYWLIDSIIRGSMNMTSLEISNEHDKDHNFLCSVDRTHRVYMQENIPIPLVSLNYSKKECLPWTSALKSIA